ncbi:MAG: outer membrane beta-barrel protein [Sulfurimonas sp.]
MKNTLALLTLLSSTIFAEATFYFGAGYTYLNETLTKDSSINISNSGAKIKVGYGEQKAYAVELSINYIDNSSPLLSLDDKEKYGFDIELMKAWDFDIYALPYVRVGFGAGKMSSSARTGKNSITYGSYNAALGALIPVGTNFELELAYEYKNISYQKVDSSHLKYSRSHQNGLYTGVNFRF